jgi:putative ABC transport system permease protein
MAGLGAISLLVAGVGVMNVMLMSVNERRREIGVRLALGARQRDIQQLFLLEAVHLSVIGALTGALLGCAVAYVFTQARDWPVCLSLDSLLLGGGSSILVGLFFGCYPATVASRLSPVIALRDD